MSSLLASIICSGRSASIACFSHRHQQPTASQTRPKPTRSFRNCLAGRPRKEERAKRANGEPVPRQICTSLAHLHILATHSFCLSDSSLWLAPSLQSPVSPPILFPLNSRPLPSSYFCFLFLWLFFYFLFLFFRVFTVIRVFCRRSKNSSAEAHPPAHPLGHNLPFFPRAQGGNRKKRKNKKCVLGARPRVLPRRRRRRPHHRRQPRRYHRQWQPGPRR